MIFHGHYVSPASLWFLAAGVTFAYGWLGVALAYGGRR